MAKILIVDDSSTLRAQLRKVLETKNHNVLEAEHGGIGLDTLKAQNDIQLVFCDVNMPIMDGLTMCEQKSAIEAIRNIPVLMVTTESSAELKNRGKAAGVRAWVTKPFNDDKLLMAVDKIVGG
jgi:two-component system, chemotaxis family, chemotaxis protein CheY